LPLQKLQLSIAHKLALRIALLILVAMGLLGIVVADYQEKLVRQQLAEMGNILISQFSESVRDPILSKDSLGMELSVANFINSTTVQGATIFDEDGKVIHFDGLVAVKTLSAKTRVQLRKNGRQAIKWETKSTPASETMYVTSWLSPVRFQKLTIGYVALTLDRSEGERLLADSVNAIVKTTFMMIAVLLIVSLVMSNSLAKPVYRLVDGLKAIVDGRLDYRIREKRNDEIGFLMETFNSMAEGLQKKAQVENVFSRFVSTNVAKRILSDMDNLELGGRHVYGSVLFADIAGFTAMSEKMEPAQVIELLNEYFSFISRASEMCHGSIDKYMGDCAMVTFGVPDVDELHSFHAIQCCVLIQRVVKILNHQRTKKGSVSVEFRVGINSGEMLAGYMGSPERMQYTVIGDSVNLASRLCTAASRGQILITEEMYSLPQVRDRIVAKRHGTIRLKGKSQPVNTYQVADIAPPYRHIIEKQLLQLTSGVS